MKPNNEKRRITRGKMLIYLVSAVVMFGFIGGLTYQVTKAQVTILQDGEAITVTTHDDTVGELLDELDIHVEAYDEMSHPQASSLASGMEIHINTANRILVHIDDQTNEYHTTAATVEAFLKEVDLQLGEHDDISHERIDSITDGMELIIRRAFPVTINDANIDKEVWITGGTVGSLLAEQKIELKKQDELSISKSDSLEKNMIITITRVNMTTEIVEEKQPYTTITKEENELDKGKTQLISHGEEGILAKHYQIRMENGKETERKLIKEEVKKESQPEIVAIGTKVNEPEPPAVPKAVKISASSTPVTIEKSTSKEEVMYMHATAYTAECSGCSGKTATGIDLKQNPNLKVIAVDPAVIPLGTKVWVEGYGTAVAGDTGGAIQGHQIDIHMPSKEAALNFGNKKVQVKILK